MKVLALITSALISTSAIAAQGVTATQNFINENSQYKESKTFICIAVAETAIDAFELKKAKQKLKYHKTDDVISAIFVKQGMDIGYKSNSEKEAAKKAFEACVNSKLWSENSKQM